MPSLIEVQTTVDNVESAQAMATALVGEHLAACAHVIGPVFSTWRWEGGLETSTEWLVVAKTRASLLRDVTEAISELHGYEIPEILALPIVGGHEAYMQWVEDSTHERGWTPSGDI